MRIARAMSRPTTTVVGIGMALPALDRSHRDADHLTCGVESCSGELGSFRAARIEWARNAETLRLKWVAADQPPNPTRAVDISIVQN
jgi:hypothetical protein